MDTAPVMANPVEYRDTLWSVLHDGEAPKGGAKSKGAAPSKSEIGEMEALMAQAKALRGESPDLDS